MAVVPFAERSEIDGRPPSAEDLRQLALINYGHFTTLQVRGGRARGFDLHMRRLQQTGSELFGQGLDEPALRRALRHLLADAADATVRITVFCRDTAALLRGAAIMPTAMLTRKAPVEPPTAPLRLRSFHYEREPAQFKHVGTMGLLYHQRRARLEGFDDALFVHPKAGISEGSAWNIGFYDRHGVVWPEAPNLPGVTRQLLEASLRQAAIPSRIEPIGLDRLAAFSGAFALNSSTIARPIAQIDEHRLNEDRQWTERLRRCYDSQPWQAI